MKYRQLGSTGLKVSEIGLGGNNFGWFADEQSSIPVIKYALEAGINFIDTADTYDRGNSESFIGKAIKGKRHDVIIATKFARVMGDGPNEKGGLRYHVMQSVEASLKRLQTVLSISTRCISVMTIRLSKRRYVPSMTWLKQGKYAI